MPKDGLIETMLEGLETSHTLDDLQTCLEELRDAFAVDHIVYHWVDGAGDQYGCGTYSDTWRDRYLERNYLRIDPVIAGCFQRFRPVEWKTLDWSSKAARAFLADAVAHGVGNQGYSIPIRGPNGQFALFTVSDNCDDGAWAAFIERNERVLLLIAHACNRKARELAPARQPGPSKALSPREVDAMTLLALGKSRAQVAASLKISEHTLRAYIENACAKLGASNTTHGVAKAMSRGLIVV